MHKRGIQIRRSEYKPIKYAREDYYAPQHAQKQLNYRRIDEIVISSTAQTIIYSHAIQVG